MLHLKETILKPIQKINLKLNLRSLIITILQRITVIKIIISNQIKKLIWILETTDMELPRQMDQIN